MSMPTGIGFRADPRERTVEMGPDVPPHRAGSPGPRTVPGADGARNPGGHAGAGAPPHVDDEVHARLAGAGPAAVAPPAGRREALT